MTPHRPDSVSAPPPLPTLPVNWVPTTVANVAAVRLGQQRSPRRNTGRYPTVYLRAANIQNGSLDLSTLLQMDFRPAERHLFALHPGDLLLAEASGSSSQVGRSALWRGEVPDCCYQNTVIRVRPHAARPEFVLLVFRHFFESGVFSATSRGVGIQHLGATRLSQLPFPLPPWDEQQRIVDEISLREKALRESIDSLRSAQQRLQEHDDLTLQAASTGELLNLPTPADASLPTTQSDPPPHDTRPRTLLFQTADDLAPASDSLPSPLPHGWSRISVGQAGTVRLGKQLTSQPRTGSHLRNYLRVANVHENRIDVADVKQMYFTDREYKTLRLTSGDILLNDGQSPDLVGRPALYRDQIPGAAFQNHLLRFRPASDVVSEYALIVFRHYFRAGVFHRIAKWSTNLATLGLKRFSALPFPLPPTPVQRRLVSLAHQRLDASQLQREAVSTSLTRLFEMQRELLRSAVFGEFLPQDPTDEPASQLLHRLRPLPQVPRGSQHSTMHEKEPRPMSPRDDTQNHLVRVLRAAKQPLSLPELFKQAGYDPDSTEDVELFYVALRREYRCRIRVVGDSAENSLLEIIDAPR